MKSDTLAPSSHQHPPLPPFSAHNPTALTPGELEYYERYGFIRFENLLAEGELDRYRQAADRLVRDCRPYLKGKPRLDIEALPDGAEPVLRKIQPIVDISADFLDLSRHPRIVARAASILGSRPVLFEDKLNLKPPRVGSEFPIHHDWGYWKQHDPELTTLISVMVFLDDSTVENGCMRLFPGSHLKDDYPLQGPILAPGVLERDQALPFPCAAGSALIFSSHTVHCSEPNRSDEGRRALIFSYHHDSIGDRYDLRNGRTRERGKLWYAAFEIGAAASRTGEEWQRYLRSGERSHDVWWNEGLEQGVRWLEQSTASGAGASE